MEGAVGRGGRREEKKGATREGTRERGYVPDERAKTMDLHIKIRRK